MGLIIGLINTILTLLWIALLIRAVLSWLPVGNDNPLKNVITQITEPILTPIRRVMPKTGVFDLSPIVAIFLIILVSNLLRRLA